VKQIIRIRSKCNISFAAFMFMIIRRLDVENQTATTLSDASLFASYRCCLHCCRQFATFGSGYTLRIISFSFYKTIYTPNYPNILIMSDNVNHEGYERRLELLKKVLVGRGLEVHPAHVYFFFYVTNCKCLFIRKPKLQLWTIGKISR
jgi:hypothetical protein